MAEFPALPLWTDAFIADTLHLGARETGAYILLLMVSWRSGKGLPDDDKLLARWAKCDPRTWPRVKPKLMAFWTLGPDGLWRQKRLEKERAYLQQNVGKMSALSKRRWLKTNGTTHAYAYAPIPIKSLLITTNSTDPEKEHEATKEGKEHYRPRLRRMPTA